MDDSDAVKRLLDGTIEPSEIEGNPRLFAMAERIYGIHEQTVPVWQSHS